MSIADQKQMVKFTAKLIEALNTEIELLRNQITKLTHDLANERVASGYAKQLKDGRGGAIMSEFFK